jgi:hypothetical protein
VAVLLGAVVLLVCDNSPSFLDAVICPIVEYGGILNGPADVFSVMVPLLSAAIPCLLTAVAAWQRVGWLMGGGLLVISLFISWVSVASTIPLWS